MTELPNIPGAPPPALLVDRREAARLLGVSPGTIDNLRTRGDLASVKLAARRLFDVADLRRLVESRKGVAR
ncbi:MAG TPA: helix-turn-helix domain-containing protein [Phycisphaerales bacterium]|nr:helix-turn-helix domain-containing protein [Phycisphaerales bacterium]